MKEKSLVKNRITEIDALRGIAVLLMIFDHFMFDMMDLFPSIFLEYPFQWRKIYSIAYDYWFWDVRESARLVVVFVFLALTGICCSFSRSNIKRGAKLGVVALLMSAATFGFGYAIGYLDLGIAFGVLHCISVMLIIIGLLEKLKTDKLVYLIIGILMIALGILLERNQPYVHYERMPFLEIFWQTVIGTVSSGGDSFSLFFNGGQIMVGVFLGKWLYKEKKSLVFKKYSNDPLTFIGRHSLVIYLVHQVAIPVIVGGIMLACGFTIAVG